MSTIFHGSWFFSVWGLASNKWKLKCNLECNLGMPDDIINQICTIFPHITFNFQGKYFRLHTLLRKICVWENSLNFIHYCISYLVCFKFSGQNFVREADGSGIFEEFRINFKSIWFPRCNSSRISIRIIRILIRIVRIAKEFRRNLKSLGLLFINYCLWYLWDWI